MLRRSSKKRCAQSRLNRHPAGSVRAGFGDGVALLSAIPGDSSPVVHEADPDVVIETNGRVILLDAKYRRHGDEYSRDELYQLIAHARAYCAGAAALVAPAVQRPPGAYPIGRDSAGTVYFMIAVDPSSEASLEQQVGSWVAEQLNVSSAIP